MVPEQEIEQQIQAKGLTAPRITPDVIGNLVDSLMVYSHHFEGTTATVAIAVLPGGYVAGKGFSACVSAANFDEKIGRESRQMLSGIRIRKPLPKATRAGWRRSCPTSS